MAGPKSSGLGHERSVACAAPRTSNGNALALTAPVITPSHPCQRNIFDEDAGGVRVGVTGVIGVLWLKVYGARLKARLTDTDASVFLAYFLGRIECTMRPIATNDPVAWCVCVFVYHMHALCKNG